MLWLRDLSLPTGTSWPKKTTPLAANSCTKSLGNLVISHLPLPGNSQLAMTLQLHQRKGLQVHQGWSHWVILDRELDLIKNYHI